MTTRKPVYRAEFRAPRSEIIGTFTNAPETAILQPPAGGPHRDWLRMATDQVGFGVQLAGETTSWVKRVAATFPTTAFTVEGWCRANEFRSFGLFSYAVTSFDNEIQVFVGPSGISTLVHNIAGPVASTAVPTDGKWHYIVFTWVSSGGAGTLYLDGAQVATTTVHSGGSISSGGTFYVGQEQDSVDGGLDPSQALEGAVDDVKVYSRAITAQEVAERYRGIVSNDASKMLHWSFDEGYGDLITDSSGTGNHGTATNVTFVTDSPITYKPFMSQLRGRRGKIDVASKNTDLGQQNLVGIDKRLATDNLTRWITGFVGNARARNALLGSKVIIHQGFYNESGVIVWDAETFYTGRCQAVNLEGKAAFNFAVRDNLEDLKADLFRWRPVNVSYAQQPSVLPVGLLQPYSNFTTRKVMLTRVHQKTTDAKCLRVVCRPYNAGDRSAGIINREDNLVTKQLYQGSRGYGKFQNGKQDFENVAQSTIDAVGWNGIGNKINDNWLCFANVKNLTSGASGRVVVHTFDYYHFAGDEPAPNVPVQGLWLREIETTSPYYISLSGVSLNTLFEVDLFLLQPIDAGLPLMINNVHVVQFLKDIVLGSFCQLSDSGTSQRGFPIDTAAFDALIADTSWPTVRYVATKKIDRIEFIQKFICKPFNLAYRVNGNGEFVPVDMRLPSSLSTPPTLVDADLDAAANVDWSQDKKTAVTYAEYKYQQDLQLSPWMSKNSGDQVGAGSFSGEGATAIKSAGILIKDMSEAVVAQSEYVIRVIFDNTDLSDKGVEFDASLLRFTETEAFVGGIRRDYIEAYLKGAAFQYVFPFIAGSTEYVLRCKRTTNVLSCKPGDWRIIDVDIVPDAVTNKRGGPRLAKCVERSEEDGVIVLSFLDAGPFVVSAVPTIGTLALNATTPRHAIDIPVTRNASGDPVTLEYALTLTSVGTIPAENSNLWHRVPNLITADGTYVLQHMPSGSRIWIRARTETYELNAKSPKLPSAWVFSSGADFVDTTAITAPSALTQVAVGNEYVDVSWTNGNNDYEIEILIDQNVLGSAVWFQYAVVLPRSTRWTIGALLPNTIYSIAVQHLDEYGGVSAKATLQITTTNVLPKCPAFGAVNIVGGQI